MTFVVVSSHESVNGKDLQQPGDSVSVHASPGVARERYASRVQALAEAARGLDAPTQGREAGSIAWVALLKLPVPAEDIDEALETLEIIIEETDDVAGELDDLIIEYSGIVHADTGDQPYPRERALDNLEAWLR